MPSLIDRAVWCTSFNNSPVKVNLFTNLPNQKEQIEREREREKKDWYQSHLTIFQYFPTGWAQTILKFLKSDHYQAAWGTIPKYSVCTYITKELLNMVWVEAAGQWWRLHLRTNDFKAVSSNPPVSHPGLIPATANIFSVQKSTIKRDME